MGNIVWRKFLMVGKIKSVEETAFVTLASGCGPQLGN
jgi:hypothetical protein